MKYLRMNSRMNRKDHNKSKKDILVRIKWFKRAIKKIKTNKKVSEKSKSLIIDSFEASILGLKQLSN